MRKIPRATIGLSRNRSHSVAAFLPSQIPAERMGTERRKVKKLRIPTRLLLHSTIVFIYIYIFFLFGLYGRALKFYVRWKLKRPLMSPKLILYATVSFVRYEICWDVTVNDR